MPSEADTLVLLAALASAAERATEIALNALWPDPKRMPGLRRLAATAMCALAGLVMAAGLQIDLAAGLPGYDALAHWQRLALTALLIGGGAAPVHELVRYVEERKRALQAQAAGGGQARPAGTAPPDGPSGP